MDFVGHLFELSWTCMQRSWKALLPWLPSLLKDFKPKATSLIKIFEVPYGMVRWRFFSISVEFLFTDLYSFDLARRLNFQGFLSCDFVNFSFGFLGFHEGIHEINQVTIPRKYYPRCVNALLVIVPWPKNPKASFHCVWLVVQTVLPETPSSCAAIFLNRSGERHGWDCAISLSVCTRVSKLLSVSIGLGWMKMHGIGWIGFQSPPLY
jgi:hypothetical protein